MNTTAHLVVGLAAFSRPGDRPVTTSAIVGSLLPDISLYAMAAFALFVQNLPPSVVFGQLYFSPQWQAVFAVDNSVFVYLIVVCLGGFLKSRWLMVLGGAALLHILLDFPLHHDDGRPHFWPATDWVFSSPISYWDRAHYGHIVGGLEALLSLVLSVVLWRRFSSQIARILICLAALSAVLPVWAVIL